MRNENARLAIDFVGESFQWRPYAIAVNHNWLSKFYREKEQWASVDAALDRVGVICSMLKSCELLGLHYIQQYLPHRVALQFGIDQDLPNHVSYVILGFCFCHKIEEVDKLNEGCDL